ncbi:DUF7545 family protein [Haloplanus salilacus]|uniref:DUF7545 family protein n=1 Tax=Haloplanus salilacus TaxID=2949994 RepID=UPI0030D3F9CA
MVDTETYTVTGPSGESDEFELPEGLVDTLSEQGERPPTVVAEITLLAFVQRSHAIVHHAEGEVPEDLREINETAEELFEERFGMTFGEATGHDH